MELSESCAGCGTRDDTPTYGVEWSSVLGAHLCGACLAVVSELHAIEQRLAALRTRQDQLHTHMDELVTKHPHFQWLLPRLPAEHEAG